MAVTGARIPAAALALAAVFVGLAPGALAQPRSGGEKGSHRGDSPLGALGEMLFPDKPSANRRPAPPPVGRYVSESGQAFVLDRSTGRPMLRFEGSNEIWVLEPHTGARGDTLYKNDAGRVVLRDTRIGGLTLFTPERREGAAAALAGESRPIRLTPVSPKALYQRLIASSAVASRAARRQIPFHAEATPASSALIADAALITADSLARMSRSPSGREQLTRVSRVFITEGPRPGVVLRQGVLIVIVTPRLGIGGRPSSERVTVAASR
ncbi:MAG TPA: DUF4908 domain-containing protein [Caulobacter sp.]|nr:DUF4908 domain-containing protein [Caulobacter sp.]